ncbi:MAG: response regulator transcription factor [Anaerolineae bacterium]|nr:response regulator transcription factor [Anaerolineae bacterium]
MTANARILVVDDEPGIRYSLEEALLRDGYAVETAGSGEKALEKFSANPFDLVLIDLKLPGLSGMELLGELRKRDPDTVVIVLTAHASLDTAVEALRQGAHDYLFKPCKTIDLRESVRRGLQNRQKMLKQQSVLRQLEKHLSSSLQNIRATIDDNAPAPSATTQPAPAEPSAEGERFLRRGPLIVDTLRHVITYDDQLLELSPTEFNLLAYLISEAPRVIGPQELVREVQGYESEQWEASETVRYHIYRIRQKIKAANKSADVIRTVRSVGYTLSE